MTLIIYKGEKVFQVVSRTSYSKTAKFLQPPARIQVANSRIFAMVVLQIFTK